MSKYDFVAAENKLNPLEIGVDDKGRIVIIQNEDYVLGIYDDEPSNYTDPFTDFPSIMNVQIGDFDNVKLELFDYVKDALKINDTIEIWSTWMGETTGIEKKTVKEEDLSVDDLRFVLGQKNREHPRCLKIYKWTRGKK